MPSRLEDIAARAGVSVATVSRVLNGKPGASEHTRRTVLATVELLGYERPRTRFPRGPVGLVVPDLGNPVFPLFVREAEGALAAHGHTMLVCTATPLVNENEYVDVLLERGAAGFVFVSGRHANAEVDHTRYAELRAAGVPMVFVNGFVEGLDAPFVATDDVEAVRRAVEFLRSLGHRRIGCAMGPARYVTSRRKTAGFVEGMLAVYNGGPVPTGDEVRDELVVHSVYSVEGGQAATEALLERGVSAVVCGSDPMALGAIRAVRACGLRVPQDVSVVGYDDSPLLAFTDPPLTTLRQDVPTMTRRAVAALLDEMRGVRSHRRELLFQADLVVRESTGPAVRSATAARE